MAVPWEQRSTVGLFRAFIDTSKQAVFQPTAMFQRPSIEGLTGGAAYGLAAYMVGNLGIAFQISLAMLVGGFSMSQGSAAPEGPLGGAAMGLGMGALGCVYGVLIMVQAPIYALVGYIVAVLGNHVSLMLLGASKKSWEETLRVSGYANASYLWFWIPCVGFFIPLLQVPYLEAVGIRETHGTTTGVAMAAVLVWRLLLVGVVVALYVAIFATMLSTMMSA